MKDNLENLIQKAKGAGLTDGEKSSVRFALLQKINSTPVPTPFWSFTFIRSYNYIPATLVILFVLGVGPSLLAQKALPGDVLYPMKIAVNENLESVLTFNAEQSAEVEAVQATRRLDEAETLASKGLLTVQQNDELKTSFSKKVNSLNTKLVKLSDSGEGSKAEQVLNNFDTNVKTKVNKLRAVSGKSTTSPANVLVTFIKNNHDDKNSRKVQAGVMMKANIEEDKNPEPVSPQTPQASLTISESAVSTTTATTTEDSLLNVKVEWSWKDQN